MLGILAWRAAAHLLRERTYASPITVLIVTINLLVHFCLSLGGEELILWGWQWFALSSTLVLEQGQVWRVVTSSWIHADYGHVFSNCVAIFVVGLALEPVLATWKFALLYALATVTASVVSLVCGYDWSAGASDGAYALIGAMLVVPVCRKLRPALLLWGLIAIFVASDMSGEYVDDQVNVAAHIAGLVVGVLIGTWSGRGATEREWTEDVSPTEPMIDAAMRAGTIRPMPRQPSSRFRVRGRI